MSSIYSMCSSADTQVMMDHILDEWSSSSPTERLYLVYYFRSFHDIIEESLDHRLQLISDAKKYVEEKRMENKAIWNFCRAILFNHFRVANGGPIMHIVARGSEEILHIALSQLSSMLPVACLKMLQQFPHYRQVIKNHPVMRSLVMRHARYTSCDDNPSLNNFAAQLFQEFKTFDMELDPKALLQQLRSLRTEELLMDTALNEYHLKLVSSSRFTAYKVVMYFSETFPNLRLMSDVQCLHLRVDKMDKYLEREYYRQKSTTK